ncbi:MAG: translation initiation factor IF-2 N-terminal domain-containing protein, partial [Clostridia bacterium]|nr:translation initiation factor IF-2 N-terminal domain-containing protein [Clostridia bacterium]
MEQKYRVHEFAKDFGLKSVEVMDLLTHFETKERTHMAVLTQQELDYLFNHYTKKYQVENFNAYFDLANRPDPEGAKKEEPKKVEPKAELKMEPKKEEPKKAEPKAEIKKEEPKAEPPKKTGPRLISKAPQPPKAPEKPVAKPAEKPAQKPAQKAEQKPVQKPAQKPLEKPAAKAPANNTQPFTKKKEKGPKQVQNYERTVRVVDTRTNDVNLGKYDDKLMDLASSHESRNMTTS